MFPKLWNPSGGFILSFLRLRDSREPTISHAIGMNWNGKNKKPCHTRLFCLPVAGLEPYHPVVSVFLDIVKKYRFSLIYLHFSLFRTALFMGDFSKIIQNCEKKLARNWNGFLLILRTVP